MESFIVSEKIAFSAEKMKKINLFASSNLFCDIYCLEPGQEQKPHTHEGSDKIYYVIEGTGTFTVGDQTRKLTAGQITWAPSGHIHGVANETPHPLVCLAIMAPHPNFKA